MLRRLKVHIMDYSFFLHPGPAYWDLTLPKAKGEGFMPSPFPGKKRGGKEEKKKKKKTIMAKID